MLLSLIEEVIAIIFSNERKKVRFAVVFLEKGQELEEDKQRLRREEHKNEGSSMVVYMFMPYIAI